MKKRLLLAILNVVGFVIVVAVNFLAVALPLGGVSTGELSDQYPNLFVPTGLTFAIWGVIYLLLASYVTYGLIVAGKQAPGAFIDRIGTLFLLTCLANAGWIFAWQYRQLALSLACMAVLLGALIALYARLNVGRSSAAPVEKVIVHLAVSVYLGWITIASIANVTAVLVGFGWDGLGSAGELWAAAMIAVGAALGLVLLFLRGDVFYALVVDWAALGILLKRTSDSAPATLVVGASIVALCLLTLAIALQAARRRVYR